MGVESESGNEVKRIVSNTGPIFHLTEAGLLENLSHTSLWISKNIMSDAYEALKKMFEAR